MAATTGMDEPTNVEDGVEDTVSQAAAEILKTNRFNIRNTAGMGQNVRT